MNKVNYPIDKRQWSPSLMPGPIAIISTCNKETGYNIAPKSWLQMVSFEPPILMFSGSKDNTTEKNILENGCFVVNIVDSSLVEKVYKCISFHGKERIEKSGFNLVDASKICAPLVADCKAHLECKFIEAKEIGSGFVIFGEIVAASIWDEILKKDPCERYAFLDQAVYL